MDRTALFAARKCRTVTRLLQGEGLAIIIPISGALLANDRSKEENTVAPMCWSAMRPAAGSHRNLGRANGTAVPINDAQILRAEVCQCAIALPRSLVSAMGPVIQA